MDRIAIIGMGCRFPGAANPKEFWKLLKDGVDAVKEVPADRWSISQFFDPDPATKGKTYARWGGFLDSMDTFDAGFFGISPREAQCLDPQQRLLLELTWEALEDAGKVPEEMAGSDTGVFMGAFTLDYMTMQLGNRDLITTHTATGALMTLLSNRISYVFDFRGPSVSIDTACSSSLVTVHMACQALRNGECKIALAGGANIMSTPEYFIAESKGGFLSADGRCKAFDSRANGYVRGEGAGIVVLKPLDAAIADGDPIYAVVRGTAVNQDGRSNGITQPRREAQEALVREACRRAGVAPSEIQYVEAHGTGTAAGDPIEANALGAVFSEGRPQGQPCLVGSLKTNVGHMEAAAGVAGLIKASLCLKHGQIPPSLHFENPNPKISFPDLNLKVATKLQPWPPTAGKRLAGVNSFGFGGTNAHAVIEEAPARQASAPAADGAAHLLTISARNDTALREFAARYRDFLRGEGSEAPIGGICHSANSRRGRHDYRLAVAGRTHEDIAARLDSYLSDTAAFGVFQGRRAPGPRPKLAFILTGMGPQWWAMGRQLYAGQPVFRQMVDTCEERFLALTGWSVRSALMASESESRMNDPMAAQTTNFVLQVALIELWRSWGVEPDAVSGHSAGEPAAAWAAGMLSLDDAILVNYHRSRMIETIAGQGAMMAVQMPVDEAERAIADFRDRISVAAENAPTSVALSGDPAALNEISSRLQQSQIHCRMLRVNVAYHSYQLDPLKDEMIRSVSTVKARQGTLPMYSTVTGELVKPSALDARYWWRNLRNAVHFRDTAERLIEDGYTLFLEIGPHPVLAGPLSECLSHRGAQGHTVASLRRGEDEGVSMAAAAGALHSLGFPIDWNRFQPDGGEFVRLPLYPFQRERYWLESGESADHRLGRYVHPLLGRELKGPQPAWEVEINRTHLPYTADHRVQGAVVFPGAGYAEMGLAAAHCLYGPGAYVIENLEFHKALFLHDGTSPRVRVTLDRQEGTFAVHSQADNPSAPWNLHSSGKVGLRQSHAVTQVNPAALRRRANRTSSQQDCYEFFAGQGFQYGPRFQRIESLRAGSQEAVAQIDADAPDSGYWLHPTVLDACFQTLIATNPFEDQRQAYMPVGIERVAVYRAPAGRMECHARLDERSAQQIKGSLMLYDQEGNVAVEVKGFTIHSIDSSAESAAAQKIDRCFYEVEWQPVEAAPSQSAGGPSGWLVLADSGGTGDALSSALRARGEAVTVVHRSGAVDVPALLEQNPGRVVYLWGLDSLPLNGVRLDELVESQDCLEVMNLSRAMAAMPKPPRLWIVTRGAQPVVDGGPDIAPVQASLWGLGRVIGNQEGIGLWGGLIDLDPLSPPEEPDACIEEMLNPAGEEVAFRDGRRYVSRLVRRRETASELPPQFRADGTYLITGGLGALGLLTADWMVKRGARRLVLMGRSALPPRSQWTCLDASNAAWQRVRAIRDLESQGATITLAPVDVTDEANLTRFLERHEMEGWPAIRGIVHSAGIVRDIPIAQMTAADFHDVMRPKAAGALLLHRLTAHLPLDFFVLFSSIGSLVAGSGQANYASANAFLDALAAYRQQRGLPAMSVNWGPWATGMVRELNLMQHFTERGMAPITASRGMQMMDRLFCRPEPQVAALNAEWPLVFERQPVVPNLILHLGGDGTAGDASLPGGTHNTVAGIRNATGAERLGLIETSLAGLAAKVLRLDAGKLDPEQSLLAFGLDSLMAIELKGRVEAALPVSLSVVDLLQGLGLRGLASKLAGQFDVAADPLSEAGGEVLEALMAELVQREAAAAH